MVGAIAAILLIPAGVTLKLTATFAPKAVEQIAKASGQELYADGSLAREVVCIDVHDVSLDDLKKKLAETIGAVWIERQGKTVLSRPDWLDRQQRDEALNARMAEIKRAMDARPPLPEYTTEQVQSVIALVNSTLPDLGNVHDFQAYDKARWKQWAALDQTPANRLLDRILRRLDLKQLASLPLSQRICYSNAPTASERRLLFDLRPLLAKFQEEQRQFLRIATAKDTAPIDSYDDRRFMTYDADPDCKRVLLVVAMDRASRLPTFMLSLLDADGWKTAIATGRLSPLPKGYTPALAAPPKGRKIELSPAATEWPMVPQWLTGPMLLDDKTHKPYPELLAPWMSRLLNPEREEPLTLTASEALIGYAEDRKMPLIALVPDRAIMWPRFGVTAVAIDNFPDKIAEDWKVDVSDQDGWLTVRPRLLADGRADRMDRAALGTFFRRIKGDGAITIDAAASYLVATQSDMAFEFDSYDSCCPGFAEKFQGEFEPRQLTIWYYRALIRFLGHLSSGQRRSLLNGNGLTVSQLGSTGRESLEELIYSRDMLEPLFKKFDPANTDIRLMRGHASDEPWEKLPNGIPASTRISCTVTEVPVILTEEGEERLSSAWTPATFGEILAGREEQPNAGTLQFKLGRGKQYDFRFDFTPDVVGQATLRELIPGERKTYAKPEDLPDSVREEVKKAFEAERKRNENARKQNKTTTPPPVSAEARTYWRIVAKV